MFFDFIFFLGFLFFDSEVSGVDDKIARVLIRVRFLRVCVCVGFFMDYEGQSGREGKRQRRVVDTKSVKFILQYAFYVRAINNKESVDNNAQIARD